MQNFPWLTVIGAVPLVGAVVVVTSEPAPVRDAGPRPAPVAASAPPALSMMVVAATTTALDGATSRPVSLPARAVSASPNSTRASEGFTFSHTCASCPATASTVSRTPSNNSARSAATVRGPGPSATSAKNSIPSASTRST